MLRSRHGKRAIEAEITKYSESSFQNLGVYLPCASYTKGIDTPEEMAQRSICSGSLVVPMEHVVGCFIWLREI